MNHCGVRIEKRETLPATSILQRRARRISFWIPITLCFGINAAIFAGIAIKNPEYLLDYRLNSNPDAVHYVLIGRNMLLHGQFSRSEGAPYAPDMLRTPIYPLFSGRLDVIGSHWPFTPCSGVTPIGFVCACV